MSCRHISPREEFQRELEDLNSEAAASIKKVVEQEMLQNKRRGPLHPSTPEEIEEAKHVRSHHNFPLELCYTTFICARRILWQCGRVSVDETCLNLKTQCLR